MKLVCLNIWGGKLFGPLMAFIREEAETADVFCFQEVWDTPSKIAEGRGVRINMLGELSRALPDFQRFFAPVQKNADLGGRTDVPMEFGPAAFVRSTIAVREQGMVFVRRERNSMEGDDLTTLGRNIQYLRLSVNQAAFTVVNTQLTAWPGDKLDTPDRLEQSRRIRAFLDAERAPIIFCGDFNLMPTTESLRMLETGMRNLVSDYGIEDTRGPVNRANYPDQEPQRFADYCLVSPTIRVKRFEVPRLSVSDHLPLILEFEIT